MGAYMISDVKKLSKNFINKYKAKTPDFGFNGLGYIVYKRTYARDVEGENRTEEWHETVQRCVEGAQEIGAGYTQDEMERLYDKVFNLKCNFAGRMLWQFGTETVKRFGGTSLLNCWTTAMREPEDFCFLFENLMLGGGVGFSVQRENIYELPKVNRDIEITHQKTNDADFIVPDSREGWVSLLRKILDSFMNGGKSFTYSTILIRAAGEKIQGFGGTASGPQILVEGMEKIIKIFQNRQGLKLRSIDVLDINNIIGSVVVAGNVRRSAEIALGDPDDVTFLKAKRWDLGNVPNWRAMSNNSVIMDNFDDIVPQLWSGYKGKGEPYGFINMSLSQKYGRLKDGVMKANKMYPTNTDNCELVNPCAEITLADGEACNLCEIYLDKMDSKEELIECAKLLYKTQKAIWNLDFPFEKTRKIVAKNRRIGLGVTGICQAGDKIDWLDDTYVELRKYDREWSKILDVPESIKLTTIKPSGTLSLLSGSSPGVHPAYSSYYIRRVRMSALDQLVKICKDAGFKTEYARNFDGTDNRDTMIVEFPCKAADNAIVAKDMTAIKQLELVKKMQTEWSDNSVSVTVYYKPEELKEIKDWLKENYTKGIKSVSFLLHNDHGFDQAPYEEIDKETYEEKLSKVDLNFYEKVIPNEMLEGLECDGGACPIR